MNTARCYLYYLCEDENSFPTKPMFYAGLGSPFKITSDIQFAVSVPYDGHESRMLIKQLEKYYGERFMLISLRDAMPYCNFRCAKCGIGWTQDEIKVVSGQDPNLKHTIHIGSPLRRGGEDSETFAGRLSNARRCRNQVCSELFCGDCASPKVGRNSNNCVLCRPSRRKR